MLRTHIFGMTCRPHISVQAFLLGACELIHMFVREDKNSSKNAENIRCHSSKFIHPVFYTLAAAGCVVLQTTTRIKS